MILALNAGSSSVKFALFDVEDLHVRLEGGLKGLGDKPRFKVTAGDGSTVTNETWEPGDADAITGRLLDWIEAHLGDGVLAAVGHRIVHGGRDFVAPVTIDDAVLARLDALTPLAPLHQPAGLAPVRLLRARRPDLPQIACFDTAFHHALAPPVSRYAIPRALEDQGIRRYGFHGLSYESIAAQLAAADDGARGSRIVVAHLGSGASLCAMRGLRSVDTTMGFTALDGLVMGTRPGAIDPGVLLYLQQARGMSVDRLEDLLYHRCGLLGVSGICSDAETLLASDAVEAHEALDLFAFHVARQTAALAATMGGIDRFVFTGGIGEHAPPIRAMIAARLGWLGAVLDERVNAVNAADATTLSVPGSRMLLQRLPAREEQVIARDVARLLRTPRASPDAAQS